MFSAKERGREAEAEAGEENWLGQVGGVNHRSAEIMEGNWFFNGSVLKAACVSTPRPASGISQGFRPRVCSLAPGVLE